VVLVARRRDGPGGWANYIVAKDDAGTTQFQVDASGNVTAGFTTTHGVFRRGDAARFVAWYDGNPEGAVAASPGAVIYNTLGGTGTTIYYKASGTGNTGWVAVSASGGGSLTLHAQDTAPSAPSSGTQALWYETDTTDFYVYDFNAASWVQVGTGAGGGGGASILDDLTDVTITAAATGDILRHNGTAWVDAAGASFFEAAGAVAAHEADTTSVHGIADTSTLYRSGGTDVAVADGGTGSSTAAGARTNLARKVVVDVMDYITDDGTTDNATAIATAIAATPAGGILDFRGAQNAIMIGSPVDLIEQRTYLFKNTAGQWPYRQTSPFPGSIKATAGFSGDALVRVREKTLSGRTPDNDTIYVSGMVVDGTNLSTGNIDCIRVEGLCRDLHFENCVGTQAEGTGRCWHFLTGSGTAAPRGLRMKTCVAHSGENYGFRFNGVTDAYLVDLLAVSNSLDGIYFSNSGENHIVGCRAVFNTQRGFFFDGTTTSGGTTVTACTTDRNGRDGFRITQSGTQPFTLVGCVLRRDGSSSTSSNYAGIQVEGASGLAAVPVEIVGCLVIPGVDDGGGGSQTPQHAVRATWAQRVNVVGGDLYGISSGFSDGGNNTLVEWSPETYWATGAIGSKARSTPTKVGPSDPLGGHSLSDVGTPASGDLVLLRDVSDSSKVKTAAFSTFGGGGGSVAGGADHLALISIGVS